MSGKKTLALFCSLFLAWLCVVAADEAAAQTKAPRQPAPTEQDNTLQALLNEVRQLRITLERLNLNAYRAQIAVERLRLQQQRVDRLAGDLESVRNQIYETELTRTMTGGLVQEMEDKWRAGQIDEADYKQFQLQVDQLAQRRQRLRERELQLTNQLDGERATLNDMNYRLDILERELESPLNEEPRQIEKRP